MTATRPYGGVDSVELSRGGFFRLAAGAGLGVAVGGGLAFGASGCTTKQPGSGSGLGQPIEVNKIPTTPYKEDVPPGAEPDLPRRVAVSLPATGEIFTDFAEAARIAAETRDLEYLEAQANGDSSRQIQQVQSFLARGIGALIAFDAAPPALEPLQRQAIEQGIPVLTGPYAVCTTQTQYDQYELGRNAGEAAARWISGELDGQARVVVFNQDHVASLRPRSEGMLDGLRTGGPGISVVKNVTGKDVSPEGGFELANTVLQTSPDVNVWLGPDSLLAGALSALGAKGLDNDSVGLFGTDGDSQALSEIAKGGIYRSTQGALLTVVSYAYGNFAADWLEGKSVPQLMVFNTTNIDSPEKVAAFTEANSNPAEAYEENRRTHEHFVPYGNTSYEHNRWLSVV